MVSDWGLIQKLEDHCLRTCCTKDLLSTWNKIRNFFKCLGNRGLELPLGLYNERSDLGEILRFQISSGKKKMEKKDFVRATKVLTSCKRLPGGLTLFQLHYFFWFQPSPKHKVVVKLC